MPSPLFSILSPIINASSAPSFLCQSNLILIPTATATVFSGKKMVDSRIRVVLNVINRIFIALLTCAFALGGAAIGVVTGAMKGQTTETGLVRGAGVGAVTGAITAVQLMEMMANGESFSKVALLHSLINGKVFMEWVSPAVLKAYQWQASGMEMSFSDMLDMDNNGTRGLSEDTLDRLPRCIFGNLSESVQDNDGCNQTYCTICLQDFKNGEEGRKLADCRHVFHLKCIDEWLIRQGSCPICRTHV